jgi:DNA repair exonuclease SbcCD ATPase subunit
LNEIDQIEQELSGLKQRFAQSAKVLEDLAHLKSQFSELTQTYQAIQSSLGQAEQILKGSPEQSEALSTRLSQIESQFETRYEQLQAQLTNSRFDFDATNRQLHEKIEQDHQELARLKQTQDQSSANSEDGDRIQWLESSLQHFNSSMYADRTALQKLERNYNDLKRLVDIIVVIGPIVSILLLVALIFK